MLSMQVVLRKARYTTHCVPGPLHKEVAWFQKDELSTKAVIPGYGFPSIAQPVYAAPVTLH